MNWFIRASKIQPVPPTGGTNYSNFLNSNFGNGWGTGDKKKKPAKKDGKPAKEPGKGDLVDVKASADCTNCCRKPMK